MGSAFAGLNVIEWAQRKTNCLSGADQLRRISATRLICFLRRTGSAYRARQMPRFLFIAVQLAHW